MIGLRASYRIRNPVPEIQNPRLGIQNPRLSWIPSHGARGTQREYSSKPLKHSIVKRILVFKR